MLDALSAGGGKIDEAVLAKTINEYKKQMNQDKNKQYNPKEFFDSLLKNQKEANNVAGTQFGEQEKAKIPKILIDVVEYEKLKQELKDYNEKISELLDRTPHDITEKMKKGPEAYLTAAADNLKKKADAIPTINANAEADLIVLKTNAQNIRDNEHDSLDEGLYQENTMLKARLIIDETALKALKDTLYKKLTNLSEKITENKKELAEALQYIDEYEKRQKAVDNLSEEEKRKSIRIQCRTS